MKLSLIGVAIVLLAGCVDQPQAQSAWNAPPGESTGPSDKKAEAEEDDEPLPTDPAIIAKSASVKVLQNEEAGCITEALGPVDVHKKMETTQKALDTLKLRAAALGAEAVINTEFEHGEGGDAPTHLSGMAVRCHDLLHGRQYEVIGPVKLEGAMGKEEDAFSQFKAKARAMKADLILDVKFEHGEGDAETTTITGTAIKLR
jgi:uncharacterized protein YbjQ (UPF0145 family)